MLGLEAKEKLISKVDVKFRESKGDQDKTNAMLVITTDPPLRERSSGLVDGVSVPVWWR